MTNPADLNRTQCEAFAIWIELGLSESAALGALREDGLIPTNDHDRLVANFVSLGLSASEAEVAADGRDGESRSTHSRTVSPGSIAEGTAESRALIATVREIAESALRHGGSRPRCGESGELAAVREAAWKVIIRLPATVAATVWAARVIEAASPGVRLVDSQGSSGSSKHSSASKPVRS